MGLETKHVRLLRSCAMFLRTRGKTPHAARVSWTGLMLAYADDLDLIADELEKLNLPQTRVNLDDIFGGEKP